MINLKIAGAVALLAMTPVLMSSSADAQQRFGGRGGGGGFRGGGMAFHGGGGAFRGGGMGFHGGGGAFRGGGAALAARPGGMNFARATTPGFAGRNFAAANPVVAGRNWNGGGRWHGGGHRWHGRRWIGPGLGFAAGLAAGSYYGGYGYGGYYDDGYYDDSYAYAPEVTYSEAPAGSGDSVAYCQQRYRSYDPASGTYLGYDGQRHPCP